MTTETMIELVIKANAALVRLYKVDNDAGNCLDNDLNRYIAYELADDELRLLIGRPGRIGHTDGRPDEWLYSSFEDLVDQIEKDTAYLINLHNK